MQLVTLNCNRLPFKSNFHNTEHRQLNTVLNATPLHYNVYHCHSISARSHAALRYCLLLSETRNLAIANKSRVTCANKVTTVLDDLQKSFKVIGNVTVRQSACDYLLPFHSDYSHIWYRSPHIARYWSKISKFIYSTCIQLNSTLLKMQLENWDK